MIKEHTACYGVTFDSKNTPPDLCIQSCSNLAHEKTTRAGEKRAGVVMPHTTWTANSKSGAMAPAKKIAVYNPLTEKMESVNSLLEMITIQSISSGNGVQHEVCVYYQFHIDDEPIVTGKLPTISLAALPMQTQLDGAGATLGEINLNLEASEIICDEADANQNSYHMGWKCCLIRGTAANSVTLATDKALTASQVFEYVTANTPAK
ncbi:MAG TPA: hypothetical protein QF753_20065 [Victivallales bacterium]|nr:hypothetical protein [Victivallales bacterium]